MILLLGDLSCRIPYGTKVMLQEIGGGKVYELIGINRHDNDMPLATCKTLTGIIHVPLKYVKPLLFPLSSMTGEQYERMMSCNTIITFKGVEGTLEGLGYLLENHFDVVGLIGKDLAIDATTLNIY